MRFYEIEGARRNAQQNLRTLNKQKQDALRRLDNDDKRSGLIRTMYGNTQRQLDWLELEKAELDVAQQRAEVIAANLDTEKMNTSALHDMALAAMARTERNKQAVERVANAERKKRRKRILNR